MESLLIEKTSTALEAGLQGPGIGDARTHGNLRRGFTADRESHKCGFKGMEERTCQVWTAQFLRSTGSEAGGGPGAGEYVVVCLCVDIIIHFSFRTTKQASSEKVTKCALFKMCISEAIICEE